MAHLRMCDAMHVRVCVPPLTLGGKEDSLFDSKKKETCSGSTSAERPGWVQSMLEECAACRSEAPETCTMLADEKSAAGHDEGRVDEELRGNSSDWTGEGSSEDLSSASDQGSHAPTHRTRETGIARSLTPVATSHGTSIHHAQGRGAPSTRRPEEQGGDLPLMLLIGDSNATGYCETQAYKVSLRRALSSSWQVHLAAKRGTTWKDIANDVDGQLQQFCKGSLAPGKFSYILFVLGTNDVPRQRARADTWDRLSESIPAVLTGVKKYLSPSTGPQNILVTTPFCFEPGHATDEFHKLLEATCLLDCFSLF